MAGPGNVIAFWREGSGFSTPVNVTKAFYLKLKKKKKKAILIPEREKHYPALPSLGNGAAGTLGSHSEESLVASSSGWPCTGNCRTMSEKIKDQRNNYSLV